QDDQILACEQRHEQVASCVATNPSTSISGVDSLRPIGRWASAKPKEQSMVRNAAIFLGTIVVLALASVSHAQPAGITREMIATALPVEGAPLAVAGPYKVEGGPAFGSPGHVVYRPVDLTPFPAKDKLPLMGWGNGGRESQKQRHWRI